MPVKKPIKQLDQTLEAFIPNIYIAPLKKPTQRQGTVITYVLLSNTLTYSLSVRDTSQRMSPWRESNINTHGLTETKEKKDKLLQSINQSIKAKFPEWPAG